MFRHIELTRGYSTLVDSSEYDNLNSYKWYALVHTRGGYVYAIRDIQVNKKKVGIRMHRHLTNAGRGMVVDHINGNTLDNRKENLRVCNNKQNLWNSPRKGCYFDKARNKWSVIFTLPNGHRTSLGRYSEEWVAEVVYIWACLVYRGEFVRANE